ncbi:MAG TPA: hypothetical protein VMB66_12280 [Candidatus Acidoferrales bacterium]|nr:hypothetical protein [Candidatus Acidoferrales bacterium]
MYQSYSAQWWIVITLAVIALIVVGVLAFAASRKRRTVNLKRRFGPEYDRVLRQQGGTRRAEGVLQFRQREREKHKVRDLTAADRAAFIVRWREVQARFVDDPRGAVTVADSLVTDVMQARGYPIAEFEQRAADLSVDYPVIVDNYRKANEIALRHGEGQASTEDLRQAMMHYRTLFDELLDLNQERKRGA